MSQPWMAYITMLLVIIDRLDNPVKSMRLNCKLNNFIGRLVTKKLMQAFDEGWGFSYKKSDNHD